MIGCAGGPAVKPDAAVPARTIAVIPFVNNTGDAWLDSTGAALADIVSARLVGLKGYTLVERQRLAQIAAEARLAMTGLTDEASAAQLGKLAGADILALGSYSQAGGKAALSVRLVKSESGEILAVATERGGELSGLDKLAERAAKKLAEQLASK